MGARWLLRPPLLLCFGEMGLAQGTLFPLCERMRKEEDEMSCPTFEMRFKKQMYECFDYMRVYAPSVP